MLKDLTKKQTFIEANLTAELEEKEANSPQQLIEENEQLRSKNKQLIKENESLKASCENIQSIVSRLL
jgi:hypothetical protein